MSKVDSMISDSENQKSSSSKNKSESSKFQITPEMNQRKNPFYLHPSDNPGTTLVANLLTSSNYLIWSRSMRIALKSKNKLCYIDGSFPQPEDEDSDEFLLWSCVDSTVTGWLVNSMTKDLAEAYAFSSSARQLWLELEDKYGKGDRPRVFHLKKKLMTLKQNGATLDVYSNNLKKLWAEINCLQPRKKCSCDVNKLREEDDDSNDVMQFLSGLDEKYDSVVDTILMMEPTPSYNKAYAIVARIEGQKMNSKSSIDVNESSAMAVKNFVQQKTNSENKNLTWRKDQKKDRHCSFCNKDGHMEDSCFKKHGQPEWHKEWKAQKGKKGSYSNNVTEAQTTEASSSVTNSKDVSNFSELFQRELQKYLKGKPSGAENSTSTSCFADFAGTASGSYLDSCKSKVIWIIDTGASSHITGNMSLFSQIKEVKGSHTVNLPDGSVKNVSHIGEVVINSKILLKDVLYVPEFRYNLISVHRLAGSSNMKFNFDTAQCIMQDLLSSQVLAVGRVEKHLYLLDSEENRNIFSLDNASAFVETMLACKGDKKDVHWHARLGHPSVNEEKVFISRDVVFYETQFPFKEVVDQEKSILRSSHDSLFKTDLVAEKYADAEDFSVENTSIPVAEIPQSMQEDSDSVEEDSVIPLDESIEVVPQETRRSRRVPVWHKDYVTSWLWFRASHKPLGHKPEPRHRPSHKSQAKLSRHSLPDLLSPPRISPTAAASRHGSAAAPPPLARHSHAPPLFESSFV
ncbi:uncharacterized protein G2W53_001951 [Senna tora]|uniref:Retrotransposon Copia-like N-terminal domain-containing protein n=1 Tax=Senna tora TaxID=362788 RepID=A0A834XJK6_9FABA|nr:uncharacterized protein G2W53_001951 [Senna tora]